MRVTLPGAVVVAVLSGCRPTITEPVSPEITSQMRELDFGRVALGVPLELEVHFRNVGRAPGTLELSTAAPFAITESMPTTVPVGDEVTIHVTFVPDHLGAIQGALQSAEGRTEVVLLGEGVEACVQTAPCQQVEFAFDSRTCVSRPVADGATCTQACLGAAGTCHSGLCVGPGSHCEDTDHCTIDACTTDGGCVHVPETCPILDPCQATFCDPNSGCASRAVEDGVPCGEELCEGAYQCLIGRCQFLRRPNADADCRYVALSTGPAHTCVVTVGKELRCWGSNERNQLGRLAPQQAAPPGFAAGLSGLRSVAAAADTVWVSREPGEMVQTTSSTIVPIDAAAIGAGLDGVACGLERGVLRCASADGGILEAGRDVSTFSMSRGATRGELCVVFADGGAACGTPANLVARNDLPAVDAIASASRGTACVRAAGRATCWGAISDGGTEWLWDGGVTSIAANAELFPWACVTRGMRVECTGRNALLPAPAPLPAEPTAVALGTFHGCTLLADGRVACWGTNDRGELGDRSSHPQGIQLRPEAATGVFSFDQEVVLKTAAGLRRLDSTTARTDDAGSQYFVSTPSSVPVGALDSGCECRTTTVGAWCEDVGPLPGGLPQLCGRLTHDAKPVLCLTNDAGPLHCVTQWDGGAVEVQTWDPGGAVRSLHSTPNRGLCALRSDGQVRCLGMHDAAAPESISNAVDLCLGDEDAGGGCARMDGGIVSCWGPWVGSSTPRAPPGGWPFVRAISCGATHFCTLAGQNIIQCWGDNGAGQLGRDGPGSTQAVSIPLAQPAQSIAAGAEFTCAQLESGRVACWGDNTLGQLGLPSLHQATVPRIVRE